MSHVATVDVIFKDLDCLKTACKAVGLVFKENQKTYKWFGRYMADYAGSDAAYRQGIDPKNYGKCDHAIGVPNNANAYEIGVVKRPDGKGYSIVWDFWNGGYGLEKLAGKDCSHVVQNYSAEVTKKQMKKKGYTASKPVVNADGEIEYTFTKW